MRMSHLASIAFACSISLFSTASFAQPPADDDRCDALSDSTPSLYGLCIAYWATQENGNSEASSKILQKYTEKQTGEDPDMPCLVPCPCWDAAKLGTWKAAVGEDVGCGEVDNVLYWEDSNLYSNVQSSIVNSTCYASVPSYINGDDGNYDILDEMLDKCSAEACFNSLSSICP